MPVLLGLVAMAAGVQEAIARAGGPRGWRLASGRLADAAVLAAGAALFLAGDVAIRRVLRTGPVALRLAGAVAALATTAVGATAGLDAQLALLAAVLAVMLAAEQYRDAPEPGSPGPAGRIEA